MRALVTEFRQESNSFTPVTSTMEFWMQNGVLQGDAVPAALRGKPCAVAGMIDALEGSPLRPEIVYGPVMWCGSGGPAEQEVLDSYLDDLEKEIRANPPVDLVLLSLHGALQTTEVDDAEGHIARRVRDLVGDGCVIASATDLHGWITRDLIETINILCGYWTYPHLDFYETGHRATTLGLAAVTDDVKPVMAWTPVPMVVSASAYNSNEGAFRELMEHGEGLVGNGTLLDFSIYQMQPWLDVPSGNSAAVAIATDPEVAQAHAKDLATRLYAARHEFATDLHPIDEVIDKAEAPGTARPVILVDSADSCNAGAPGDSMAVAARILERGSTIRAAVVVNDAPAARRAHELGVGSTARFRIGGTRDPQAVAVEVDAYVKSLHDGVFTQEGPAGRGLVNRIGRTAVLSVGGLEILVCEWMTGNGDPQLFRAFGIEPTLFDLVGVKANTSFRAGYTAFAGEICETDTPGTAAPAIERLPFRRLPTSLFPWTDADDIDFPVTFGPSVANR
ncbi:M81 family metallopeptidase [Pseudonocardia parietis]|uniref:Microcystin degradation protein MlrC n=1 Tax=Pseudonocardia parietis TaxID=570936 RepID=A0ABS4VSQ2_9PSEU|nr:M81 family metallopeptidase [Pseudonocardia parietis]MBP2366952.1 microcystin degradation protein MlrC [Pseudonocardia parietis]